MSELGHCRSCGALVMWAVNAQSGRPMPIDPVPCDDGNVVLDGERARVLKKGETTDQPRRKSHFATCPQAGGWRRK